MADEGNEVTAAAAASSPDTEIIEPATVHAQRLAYSDFAETGEIHEAGDEWYENEDEDGDHRGEIPRSMWIFGTIVVIGLVYLAYTLGTVINRGDSRATASPTSSAAAPTADAIPRLDDTAGSQMGDADAKFVASVRSNMTRPDSVLAAVPDDELVNDAHLICNDLEHHTSTLDVENRINRTVGDYITATDFGWFANAASATYCPQR